MANPLPVYVSGGALFISLSPKMLKISPANVKGKKPPFMLNRNPTPALTFNFSIK